MPVRARLLDMGEVGAVRALGLRLALAERADEPSVLVARAASSAVTLGQDADASGRVDLESCAAREIPVVRLPGASLPAAIASGSLLVSLILPVARASALGLPSSEDGLREWLADLVRAGDGLEAGAPDAVTTIEVAAETLIATVCLTFDRDPRLAALLTGGRSRDEGGEETSASQLRSPADLAESLLRALETRAGLELVPSMPLPDELDGVYTWESRLARTARQAEAESAV